MIDKFNIVICIGQPLYSKECEQIDTKRVLWGKINLNGFMRNNIKHKPKV